ncbi:cell division protein ZapA [Sphingomonas donggukensis]|uniref:Cell division protein ZapA n=1 Tax=Sphingomonas donggukensis TaxID=2949093 RepID=A0ABY4TZJ6_9SPHN|nr:cell division protein ZapA [Sphingomonas donggukensis]URW76549.1 cell division protein ZapA [Sphingomonas donggukensis]
MAEVTLRIGGRAHTVACRDGGEADLEALGRRLDAHAQTASRAAGGQSGERTMLYIALLLADELAEAERAPGTGPSSAALARIAERLESIAAGIEDGLEDHRASA